jgi:hypothetical protein
VSIFEARTALLPSSRRDDAVVRRDMDNGRVWRRNFGKHLLLCVAAYFGGGFVGYAIVESLNRFITVSRSVDLLVGLGSICVFWIALIWRERRIDQQAELNKTSSMRLR